MTIPYNATKYTLTSYFKEGMSAAEKELIKPHLNFFIDSIKKTFSQLFEISLKDLKTLPQFHNSYTFKLNNNLYDLTYYTTDTIEREVKHQGRR